MKGSINESVQHLYGTNCKKLQIKSKIEFSMTIQIIILVFGIRNVASFTRTLRNRPKDVIGKR